MKTWKGREKKVDYLVILGPKKRYGSEFPQFSFRLIYPRFGAEADGNPELQRPEPETADEYRQIKPQEKPAFFSQRLEKEQSRMTEDILTITALLQPSPTNCGPTATHCSKGQVGS